MRPFSMARKETSRPTAVRYVVPVRIARKPFNRRDFSSMDTSEKNLETLIEQALLMDYTQAAPHATPKRQVKQPTPAYQAQHDVSAWEGVIPGGYRKRTSADYDTSLCLITDDVFTFLYATQPQEWDRFKAQYQGDTNEARKRFLQRLHQEIKRRGTLDVLRRGISGNGCHFKMAYYKPAATNPELERLYAGNVFSVIRQFYFHQESASTPATDARKKPNPSTDLALFLNGLPIFTAELKNVLKGQTVEEAIEHA